MSRPTVQLAIEIVHHAGEDPKDIQKLNRFLREELTNLDVETVDYIPGKEITAGAKAADPVTWGAVLVTLAASGGVLTNLIGVIQSWLTRNERRSIKLKIAGDTLEVTNISSEEESRLIRAWINRHKAA